MAKDLAVHRFQERSIKTWIAEMNSIFESLKEREDYNDVDFTAKEINKAKRDRFEYLANRVYNLCIAYFETLGLPVFTARFVQKMEPFFSDQGLVKSYTFLGNESSAFTQMLGQFLNAFPEFGGVEEPTGIDFLENLLNSTAIILKEAGVSPISENQVSSSVKTLCKAIFPKAMFPTESFQKTAKCYIPDILIPTLGCAVEYKYAPTEQKLISTIDEILVDVRGYDGHAIYQRFYAVFYTTPGHTTETRFNQIWSEKKFPENWKGIFVLGN